MTAFQLAPQLAADSVWIADQAGCSIRLINDARYVWVILVPLQGDIVELHDLPPEDFARMMGLARTLGQQLHSQYGATKINTAAIGNIVSQLHLHIVVRHSDDPAWPAPVWGHSPAEPMSDTCRDERIATIQRLIRQ